MPTQTFTPREIELKEMEGQLESLRLLGHTYNINPGDYIKLSRNIPFVLNIGITNNQGEIQYIERYVTVAEMIPGCVPLKGYADSGKKLSVKQTAEKLREQGVTPKKLDKIIEKKFFPRSNFE